MSEKHNHEEDYLHRLRHSVSHVMAQAVLEKFPEGKVAIGPPIENGFYYDFDLPRPLTPEDLEEIEGRMREIIAEGHDFEYRELSEEEARRIFADQPYKLELIDGILSAGTDEYGEPLDEAPKPSIYQSGPFTDLCRGPHVGNTARDQPRRDQTAQCGRGLLAWRRATADASAHLRHGLEDQETVEETSPVAGRDREARPSQTGQATRPGQFPPGGWGGAGLLASQGRADARPDRGLLAQAAL